MKGRPAAALSEDVLLPAGQRQRPVPAQTVMVVDVAVSERQGEDALADQLLDGVLDAVGGPVIGEAAGEAPGDAEAAVQIPQEHDAGIGCEGSAVEADLDGPVSVRLQDGGLCATVCLNVAVCLQSVNSLTHNGL